MYQTTLSLSPPKVVPQSETTASVTEVVSVSSTAHTPVLVDPVRDANLVTTVTGVVSAMAASDCSPAAVEGVRSSHVDPSVPSTATRPAGVDIITTSVESVVAVGRRFPAAVAGSGISSNSESFNETSHRLSGK